MTTPRGVPEARPTPRGGMRKLGAARRFLMSGVKNCNAL